MPSFLATLRQVVEPTVRFRVPASGRGLVGGGLGGGEVFTFSESRWYLVLMVLGLFVMLSVLASMVLLSSDPVADREKLKATSYVAAGVLSACLVGGGLVLMDARRRASVAESRVRSKGV